MAKMNGPVNVDTGYLRELADEIRGVSILMQGAAIHVNKARRHTSWKCNGQETRVTDGVDIIKGSSESISGYLDKLRAILIDSAAEFDRGQGLTMSGMGSADIKGL